MRAGSGSAESNERAVEPPADAATGQLRESTARLCALLGKKAKQESAQM